MKEFVVVIKGKYQKDKSFNVVKEMLRLGYVYPRKQEPLNKADAYKYGDTAFRASESGKIYHACYDYYIRNYPNIEFVSYEDFIKFRSSLMKTE